MADITAIREALRRLARAGLDPLALTHDNAADSVRVVPAVDDFDVGNGMDRFGFNVVLQVGPVGANAERLLDLLLDPEYGMRAALEGDRTLSGLVSDTVVVRCSGYQVFPNRAGAEQLGATWLARCLI